MNLRIIGIEKSENVFNKIIGKFFLTLKRILLCWSPLIAPLPTLVQKISFLTLSPAPPTQKVLEQKKTPKPPVYIHDIPDSCHSPHQQSPATQPTRPPALSTKNGVCQKIHFPSPTIYKIITHHSLPVTFSLSFSGLVCGGWWIGPVAYSQINLSFCLFV